MGAGCFPSDPLLLPSATNSVLSQGSSGSGWTWQLRSFSRGDTGFCLLSSFSVKLIWLPRKQLCSSGTYVTGTVTKESNNPPSLFASGGGGSAAPQPGSWTPRAYFEHAFLSHQAPGCWELSPSFVFCGLCLFLQSVNEWDKVGWALLSPEQMAAIESQYGCKQGVGPERGESSKSELESHARPDWFCLCPSNSCRLPAVYICRIRPLKAASLWLGIRSPNRRSGVVEETLDEAGELLVTTHSFIMKREGRRAARESITGFEGKRRAQEPRYVGSPWQLRKAQKGRNQTLKPCPLKNFI